MRCDCCASRTGPPRCRRYAREVLTALPDPDAGRPPLLFVPGLGHGAWAFAGALAGACGRRAGSSAYALSPRDHGDLRVICPRRAAGGRRAAPAGGAGRPGAGALVVARALAPLPGPGGGAGRAGAATAGPALGAALRTNPCGTLPGAVRRPAARSPPGSSSARELPAEQAADVPSPGSSGHPPAAAARSCWPAGRPRRWAARRCWCWAARTTGWRPAGRTDPGGRPVRRGPAAVPRHGARPDAGHPVGRSRWTPSSTGWSRSSHPKTFTTDSRTHPVLSAAMVSPVTSERPPPAEAEPAPAQSRWLRARSHLPAAGVYLRVRAGRHGRLPVLTRTRPGVEPSRQRPQLVRVAVPHGAYSVRHLENPLFSARQNCPGRGEHDGEHLAAGHDHPAGPGHAAVGPQVTYAL